MYDEFNPCDSTSSEVQKKSIILKDENGETTVEDSEKNDLFIEIKIPEKAGDESSLFLHFSTIGEKIDWYSVLTGEMVPGEEELSDDD
jgi:hypothetical protein